MCAHLIICVNPYVLRHAYLPPSPTFYLSHTDHWKDYLSKRQSDSGELGKLNASWKEAFFPLVAGKPKTSCLEVSKYVSDI